MCLLTFKIIKDGKEEVIKDIFLIEIKDGKITIYNMYMNKVCEVDLEDVRYVKINTLDAVAVLDFRLKPSQSPQ